MSLPSPIMMVEPAARFDPRPPCGIGRSLVRRTPLPRVKIWPASRARLTIAHHPLGRVDGNRPYIAIARRRGRRAESDDEPSAIPSANRVPIRLESRGASCTQGRHVAHHRPNLTQCDGGGRTGYAAFAAPGAFHARRRVRVGQGSQPVDGFHAPSTRRCAVASPGGRGYSLGVAVPPLSTPARRLIALLSSTLMAPGVRPMISAVSATFWPSNTRSRMTSR